MAEIFLAKSLGTLGQQRLTVIKRVLPLLSADPQFSEMLVEEAKLCASLNHKNVVQVTDLGRVDDQLYIAMEYVEGFDLNDLLKRCTRAKVPMPAEFVFLIIEETLRALDFAHRANDDRNRPLRIIHRDVSPTNVLISCEGEVKLCDFGIARATARDGTLPQGVLKGKFAYMSPEQARSDVVDQRSDLFAAGILLWEMIAGRRLYRGDAGEVLAQAQIGAVPPLPDRGLPHYEEIAGIVSCALDPIPEDRYQSAHEMLEDLGDYVHRSGLFASQLRFAQFLRDNFGEDLQRQRRARERASTAMVGESSLPTSMASPSPSPGPAQGYASASPSPGPLAGFGSSSPEPAAEEPPAAAEPSPTPEQPQSSPKLEIVPELSPPPPDMTSPEPAAASSEPPGAAASGQDDDEEEMRATMERELSLPDSERPPEPPTRSRGLPTWSWILIVVVCVAAATGLVLMSQQ